MPTVRIQLVVYGNEFEALHRTTSAVRACIRHSVDSGRIDGAAVKIGDCSPKPALDQRQIAALSDTLDAVGAALSYEFFDANLGSAGGSNRLAVGGDEPVIWVLNPDTYPAPTCLSLLLDAAQQPGVAAAEARQLPIEHPKGYDTTSGEATWLTGACMLALRSAFDAVDGFDAEHFPLYCDDVDISWRWRAAGFSLRTVPRATVFHDKRPDVDGRPRGSDIELESGALARLKLARRYCRPDVEQRDLLAFESSGVPMLQRVARRFRELDDQLALPVPLPDAAHVADLDQRYYGPHRFRYHV